MILPNAACNESIERILATLDPEDQEVLREALGDVLSGEEVASRVDVRARVQQGIRKAKVQAIRRENSKIVKSALKQKLEALPAADRVEALLGAISPIQSIKKAIKPIANSIGPRINHAQEDVWRELSKRLSKIRVNINGKSLDVETAMRMEDTQFADAVMAGMYGLRPALANTVPAVNEVVGVFREMLEQARQVELQYGIPSGKLENYFPQNHSIGAITLDVGAWKSFLRENLDPETHGTITDDLLNKLLGDVRRRGSGEALDGIAAPNETRMLFFKNKEAEMSYARQFSGKDPLTSVFNKLVKMHQRGVLASEFGPDPLRVIKELKDETLTELRQTAAPTAKQNKQGQQIDDFVDFLSGKFTGEQNLLSNRRRTAANWLTMAQLGKVVTYTVMDVPAQLFQTARVSPNTPMIQRFGTVLKRFTDVAGNTDEAQLLRSIQSQEMENVGGFLERLMPGDVGAIGRTPDVDFTNLSAEQRKKLLVAQSNADRTSAWVSRYFKFAGVEHLTNATIDSGVALYSRELANLAGKSLDDVRGLNPGLHSRLLEYGVDADTWRRMANPDYVNGSYLDPGKIADDFKAKNVLQSFLRSEAEIAIGMPDLYSKMWQAKLGKRGTKGGEAFNAAIQYHMFRYNYMRRMVLRSMREGGAGGFVGLMTAMTGAGVLHTQLVESLSGRPTFEWDSPLLYARALDTSNTGWLAVTAARGLFESKVSGYDKTFGDVAGDQLGPIVSLAFDSSTLAFNAGWDAAVDGEISTGVTKRGIRTAASLIPMLNLVYFDWAKNLAIQELLSDIDPMYERHTRDTYQKQGRDVTSYRGPIGNGIF